MRASSTKKLLNARWIRLCCMDLRCLELRTLDILQVVYHANIASRVIHGENTRQVAVGHRPQFGS